ncbi:MAG TPA: hypothetical protein VIG24_12205 [Acidimicrobiia bacterium]
MLAGRYDIIADQGSTLQRDLKYFDAAGSAVDLTNYTAAMQVRENYGATATILSISSEGTAPAITLGTTDGLIEIEVAATVMAEIPAGVYVYDLELTDDSSVVTKPVRGQFEVRPEVTR